MKKNLIIMGLSLMITLTGCVNNKEISEASKQAFDKNKEYYQSIRKDHEKFFNDIKESQNKNKVNISDAKDKINKPNLDKTADKGNEIKEVKLPAKDIYLDSQTYPMEELSELIKWGVKDLTPTPDDIELGDRRIISEDGYFSFKVRAGSTYTIKENGDLMEYTVKNQEGEEYMGIGMMFGESAYHKDGITDTGTFLHFADDIIREQFPDADPEIIRIGNSHIAVLYNDMMSNPMKSMALVRDGYGNVFVIAINDMYKNNMYMYDAVMNLELFRSDCYRFINDKDRDKVYLNKINSVTNMNL